MSFPENARFSLRTESVAWSTLGDDAVLVQLERDEIHVANSAGALLVESLRREGGASVQELTSQVLEAYEVDESVARADVERFLEGLIRANVVSLNEPENAGIVRERADDAGS